MSLLRLKALQKVQSICRFTGKYPFSYICARNAATKNLHDTMQEKIPEHREKVAKFRKEHGKFKLGDVTIGAMYGGMRGLRAIVWETSKVDANEGLIIRGHSINDCTKVLPKAEGGESPLPEGLFWLMLTDRVPSQQQVEQLKCEWNERSVLPKFIVQLLKDMPKTMHPMSQLSCAMTALNHDSKFVKAHQEHLLNKNNLWEYAYEDAMDLIAKISVVAAIIYRNTFRDGKTCPIDPALDWSANYANMLGFDDCNFTELIRLYLTIHADNEGGNVSAHATHLVGSALSDPYLSYAAGINGLAGPLHGLANQEVLIWIRKMQKEVGQNPTEQNIADYVDKTLKAGQVVPGYGHAVLRKTDARYLVQYDFATKHMPDDETFKLVQLVYKVVPPILTKLGKVQNPYPNVDAISGTLLQYYGMKEMNYYTVLFAVSRAMGVMASLIWSRALGFAIERPLSETTEILMKIVEDANKKNKNDDCKK